MSNIENFAFNTGQGNAVTSQRPLQALPLQNFLGGINLQRADTQLFDNESGDLCNIDVQASGGFCRRQPVRLHTREDLPTQICDIAQWQDEDGEPVLYMTLEDGSVYVTIGGRPAEAVPQLEPYSVDANCQSIQIGFNHYFHGPDTDATCVEGGPVTEGGTNTVVPWQTVDATPGFSTDCKGELIALGCDENGNPDLEVPFVFGFPQAVCMDIHSDFAWAGNVTDPVTGERHCNRVYRSFPLTGAAATGQVWGSQDYIDIDPGDGDCITGIKACGPNLYIFKNNSVYVIQGWEDISGDNIVSVQLCGDAGAADCKAMVCCGCEIFFWDDAKGLYKINGTQVEWVFAKLYPLITEGCIRPNCQPVIGCCNGRIWVSVPEFPVTPEDEEVVQALPPCSNTTTYVLEPSVESWTKYTFGLDCYLPWRPRADKPRCLAASSKGGFFSVVELERPGYKDLLDVFNVGGGTKQIEAYWRSKWFDGGNPFTEKEWCRPQFLVESTRIDVDLAVTFLKDWDISDASGSGVIKFFPNLDPGFIEPDPQFEQLEPGGPITEVCPDDGLVVSDATCPISNIRKESQKGPSIGDSHSMQMFIAGPTNKPWCVCAVLLAYTEEALSCA